ncbi:hypothetical protein [Novosphingobium sp. Gsoil 351]|uniref:hypothetical protein n=1 Tax=Novosphingobium sp. Gsoil 351 TaxID=2675225 RepID=UPI0012B5014B|nr:hypothetical protein [Novosphingobium sp. Gsoil 351]QGN54474.1 hypothetical protein GKE62_07795 [Novosphingobium sp. Gsoil 351]
MRFVTVRQSSEQTTIVNVDQITYLNHDIYGTKIFFSSGDNIVCTDDIDQLSEKLFGAREEPEAMLITPSR